MSTQTELENKVAKIFSRVLSAPLENEPGLKNALLAISLVPFSFSEDLPKAMVITMPLELLIYAKLHSKELTAALKKEIPKYMIVMRRVARYHHQRSLTQSRAARTSLATWSSRQLLQAGQMKSKVEKKRLKLSILIVRTSAGLSLSCLH
ncbi:uncharacterized protein VICG_00234 [Vittaforma corneae ATCC 50505]|uniref:Uncharacterized protein n=1 Tax=Vittaforma corneae (strain ATCC 50505) TaxID=993615 RepID=L2GQL6_VITCO|nr:uncharacterized protein VICG_00234 [Vittaforma corneae ATCC 50505]ELA42919.1 hypothetical protein VICG_00234 [Vittaforma corneae ATCC 50505]